MTINEFFEWQKWWKSAREKSEADAARMVMQQEWLCISKRSIK
jgi:hypothetical protein